MKIKALIIGAGNIASLYDEPTNDKVLTHAHAIRQNDDFVLIGFVDVDLAKAKVAADTWGGRAYSSIEEVKDGVDLICIAVPDKYHYQMVKEAVNRHPMAIIIEKPLSLDFNEGRELADIVDKRHILAEVNYSRRFITGFSYLKGKISSMGLLLGGTVLYGKGLIHNGSHMVNLLLFLFGNMRVVSCLNAIEDYALDDKSKEIVYEIDNAYVVFQPVDARNVTVFEFDLRFSLGRVKYDGSTEIIYLYGISESPIYSGELNYTLKEKIKISPSEAMANLYTHIRNMILGNEEIVSSVDDAYKTLQLCKW